MRLHLIAVRVAAGTALTGLALSLFGCGGSQGSSSSATTTAGSSATRTSPTTPPAASTPAPSSPAASTATALLADFGTPDEVIAALSAAGTACGSVRSIQLGPNDTYLAAASTCSIGAETVAVASFTSAEQRAEYLSIGMAHTGAYPHFVMGTTWAVATLTVNTAQTVAAAIGGDVY